MSIKTILLLIKTKIKKKPLEFVRHLDDYSLLSKYLEKHTFQNYYLQLL